MAMLSTEISQQPAVIEQIINHWQEGYNNTFLKNKRVFLFGTGASLSACMQAKYAFLKYTKLAPQVIPAFEAGYYIPILEQEDFVIIVSQSGESFETKVICEQLKSKNIVFYAITNNPNSFLGKEALECFSLEAGEELGTATKTQTASTMILYMLAAGYEKEVMKQLKKLPQQMELSIAAAREYVEEFADFVGKSSCLYLTGLDAQAPTALQASLMMKEKVRIHAEGVGLAEFRHGPVEVLQQDIPILLIGFGKEETLLCHANFLSKVCNARVGLVTNSQEKEIAGYPNFSFCWDGEEEFSHICATIPFQILAEKMADRYDYDIDGFRYIGKILNQYETKMKN